MKLSEYINHLKGFADQHGDLDIVLPDPTADLFQERDLIGIKKPVLPVVAECFLVDDATMIIKPRSAVYVGASLSDVTANKRKKYPDGGQVALLAVQ